MLLVRAGLGRLVLFEQGQGLIELLIAKDYSVELGLIDKDGALFLRRRVGHFVFLSYTKIKRNLYEILISRTKDQREPGAVSLEFSVTCMRTCAAPFFLGNV